MKQAKSIMKKTTVLFMAVAMAFGTIVSAGKFAGNPVTVSAATMKLDMQSAELIPNETLTLEMVSAGKKKVVWKSSDKNVAVVSSKGVVTAKDNIGKSCTITATVDKKTYKCKISVIESKPYGTYYVDHTNFTKSGIASDGETYLEKADIYYVDILKKKNGYYFSGRAYKLSDSIYYVRMDDEYIGQELPECFTNPVKYKKENAVNLFIDAKGNFVFEAWREYTDDEWKERMKELGHDV